MNFWFELSVVSLRSRRDVWRTSNVSFFVRFSTFQKWEICNFHFSLDVAIMNIGCKDCFGAKKTNKVEGGGGRVQT